MLSEGKGLVCLVEFQYPWWRVGCAMVEGWVCYGGGGGYVMVEGLGVLWWRVGCAMVEGWVCYGGGLGVLWWRVGCAMVEGWVCYGGGLGVLWWRIGYAHEFKFQSFCREKPREYFPQIGVFCYKNQYC